ncbi:MAG: tetratricopeptide repeat protein [Bacteroidetes bacterium]|nr:tetratricopeptide repeat protein [Bacteroidota bacterium]
MKKLICILTPILFAACSSLPESQPVSPASSPVTGALRSGYQSLRSGDTERARGLFEQSYGQATLHDDIPLKIRSGLAMARVARQAGDQIAARRWEIQSRKLIDLWEPDYLIYHTLYQAERFWLLGRTDSIRQITGDFDGKHPWLAVQLQAYRVLAFQDQSGVKDEVNRLESMALDLSDPSINESEDPGALAFAWYTAGRSRFRLGDYKSALENYEQARLADQKSGNASGLADDLSGIAQSYEKLGKPGEAESAALRSWEINAQLNRQPDRDLSQAFWLELRLAHDPSARVQLEQLMRSTTHQPLADRLRQRFFR